MKFIENVKSKIFNYVNQRFSLKKSTHGFFRLDCTYCGGRNTMGINVGTFTIHCFKCGIHVNPIKFIMDVEDLKTKPEVYALLRNQEGFDRFQEYRGAPRREDINLELPPSFHLLNTPSNDLFSKSAQHYVRKRGFDVDRLAYKGVGYCDEGPYAGYIVFPFFSNGKLKFFQGRQFMQLGGPKMMNPMEEEVGIGKSELFYNEDALHIYNRIKLVESITNAETLGDRAVACLGKPGETQTRKIIKAPFEELVVMLDGDAYDVAIKFAMQVVHFKKKIKVVQFPENPDKPGEYLDVNDLGKKKALRLEKQTPWQTYNDLLKIKIALHI